ncbi:MAG: radical SAM protein [Candidatus Omnitrophica bacterium]|nr:radical SAM protein [Candidatus Omnitrophota bacterium]
MKKTILLINPWICDFTAYDLWMFPYGLLRLASVLGRTSNIELNFIDCTSRFTNPEAISKQKDKSLSAQFGTGHFFKEQIIKPSVLSKVPRKFFRYGIPPAVLEKSFKSINPDLILLTSGMTYWYVGVAQTVDFLRKIFKECPIILGGIYPSFLPVHAKENIPVDAVFSGNDMKAAVSLISQYLGMSIYFDEKAIGFPDFSLLANKKALPVLGSYGCPFRCTYCASASLYPEYLREEPQSMLNHIVSCAQKFKTTDFIFYDDALLFEPENFIKPLLRAIVHKRLKLRFHTPNGLHARYIDDEIAGLMYESGFKTLRLSFESTLDFLQQKSKMKVTNDCLETSVKTLKKAGFSKSEIGVYTLIGFPGQAEKDIIDDMEFIFSLQAQVFLASFSLVPQSRDWFDFMEKGIINEKTDPLLLSHTAFPVLYGKFTPQAMRRLRNRAGELNRMS